MYDFKCATCKGIDQCINLDASGMRDAEMDYCDLSIASASHIGYCNGCLRAPLVKAQRKGKERMESHGTASSDIAWLAAWGRSEISGAGAPLKKKKAVA